MAIIVGSGDYRYEQIDNWAKVPAGWSLHEVGAVGVDPKTTFTCSIAANIR